MDCPIKTRENREWLLDYAAGQLAEEQARVVKAHVESCHECARFVEAQQLVWNALSQWEPEAVTDDFDRRLYRTIDHAKPVSWINRIFGPLQPVLWRPVFPLAAACLIIVAGMLLRTPQLPVTPMDSQARVEKIEPDQVERSLDDMQMLRELDLKPQPEVPKTM